MSQFKLVDCNFSSKTGTEYSILKARIKKTVDLVQENLN